MAEKIYNVTVRQSLYVDYEVSADSREAAEDKALRGWGTKVSETWGEEPQVVDLEEE